jgi:hypothetical protein
MYLRTGFSFSELIGLTLSAPGKNLGSVYRDPASMDRTREGRAREFYREKRLSCGLFLWIGLFLGYRVIKICKRAYLNFVQVQKWSFV